MTTSFRLPDLGEGVHEAEILEIPISAGQSIKEGDIILEVETDKAAVEIPSPYSGIIDSIRVSPGETVNVGDVLIIFKSKNVDDDAISEVHAEGAEEKHSEKRDPGDKKKKRVPASPSTRRIARELGVELHAVTPSGSGGLVTSEDVRRHAESGLEVRDKVSKAKDLRLEARAVTFDIPPLPDFSQWGEIERQPFRSIRRATASRMSASWNQIPHVNCQDVADVTKLEEFRQRHKKEIEADGGRLTMTVFTMKAVATALKTFPQFNASLDLEAQEIILKKYFHIGIAVDTPHGLVVPVIRDVDRKSIKEIAIEINQTLARARNRESDREEMVGGSFTITNAGAIGGGYFSAIINYPEIAILGLGQARMEPAVVTGSSGRQEIVPRLLMPVVLCFDHRVADGADAIRFQRLIIDALEDPDELLITMI